MPKRIGPEGYCDDCGMNRCMCNFYWKDGDWGQAFNKDLPEEERADSLVAAPPGNWGNPVKGWRRDEDGVLVFTVARGGLRTKPDLQEAFPGCKVEWTDYNGSLGVIVRKADGAVEDIGTPTPGGAPVNTDEYSKKLGKLCERLRQLTEPSAEGEGCDHDN